MENINRIVLQRGIYIYIYKETVGYEGTRWRLDGWPSVKEREAHVNAYQPVGGLPNDGQTISDHG
jgi:hypothetical protein